jgi:hypothetical protein
LDSNPCQKNTVCFSEIARIAVSNVGDQRNCNFFNGCKVSIKLEGTGMLKNLQKLAYNELIWLASQSPKTRK